MDNYQNKIINFYQRERRMPGYKEIMTLTGFKSKNAVYKLINKMVEAGLVTKDSQGRLSPNKSVTEVPLLGLVEAGFPTMVEEDLSNTISFDDYLIDRKKDTYVLEVKGDSMIEEGICEGDLVVVEKTKNPKIGDIVIAEVDGGWTMKFLREKNGQKYLEPANKNYPPIYPQFELEITAVVKGVIRKY
ncbi:MAG: repressor LexA [Candidatus Vogelbacteria bacterium CG22_combo_CG10-13_8_21_14_all_37_9]|uniref:Repressor LexA n=1 Tax=Candidatus Vogelbacteria bacterium CG22_combo_CG10-13_8_21_14_all_37_9 TaxID=1975046 RepID=A0A2H0BKX3_9BACT|nr:MAG: repressor LexA [Candidatus Vogelbacteria bacterium CG22_combo_CG10-13_8_21_14_all_37_9]